MAWLSARSCYRNWYCYHLMGLQHTNRQKIKTNKPDITVKDKREKICKSIDVKIPVDKKVSVVEFEKLSK